jgi:hypothetical protein
LEYFWDKEKENPLENAHRKPLIHKKRDITRPSWYLSTKNKVLVATTNISEGTLTCQAVGPHVEFLSDAAYSQKRTMG